MIPPYFEVVVIIFVMLTITTLVGLFIASMYGDWQYAGGMPVSVYIFLSFIFGGAVLLIDWLLFYKLLCL